MSTRNMNTVDKELAQRKAKELGVSVYDEPDGQRVVAKPIGKAEMIVGKVRLPVLYAYSWHEMLEYLETIEIVKLP